MPTGYTAALHDGKDQTFTDFALDCARAFGALITMRDEPDAPIPDEFPPSEHDKRWRDEALKKLIALERRTPEEWEAAQREEITEHNAYVTRSRQQSAALRGRYEAMLAEVQAWQPPTTEHEELKRFMTSQLEESIKHDCGDGFLTEREEKPVQAYADHHLQSARDQLARAEQSWQAEQSRAKGRTTWVRKLRNSLPTSN